jgi:hypothetical protein
MPAGNWIWPWPGKLTVIGVAPGTGANVGAGAEGSRGEVRTGGGNGCWDGPPDGEREQDIRSVKGRRASRRNGV